MRKYFEVKNFVECNYVTNHQYYRFDYIKSFNANYNETLPINLAWQTNENTRLKIEDSVVFLKPYLEVRMHFDKPKLKIIFNTIEELEIVEQKLKDGYNLLLNNKINMNKEKDNFYAAKKEYDNFIKKYSVELTDEEIDAAPFSTMLKMGFAKGNSLKLETKEQHDKLDELRENYNKSLHEYNKTKSVEITLPPLDDLDDNGDYIGNDINFLIKNDITKDDALDKFHNFSFDDLKSTTKRLFTSQIFILNDDEWEKLIGKLNHNHFSQLKNHHDFDTVEIQNYIFKKIKK